MSRGLSGGDILAGMFFFGVPLVGLATYGNEWGPRSPEAIETTSGTSPDGETTTGEQQGPTGPVIPLSDLAGVKAELIRLAEEDPWCTTQRVLTIPTEYVLPEGQYPPIYGVTNNAGNEVNTTQPPTSIVRSGETTDVVPCIDAESLQLNPHTYDEETPNYGVFYWRTEPGFRDVDGGPSLFLTYKQNDELVKACIDMREEMRGMIREDLVKVIGAQAAESFVIEMRLTPDAAFHPCNDGFTVPFMNPNTTTTPEFATTLPPG